MEELLQLIKKYSQKVNTEHWLVAYTNCIIEIHNEHKAIICATSIEQAKDELINKINNGTKQ